MKPLPVRTFCSMSLCDFDVMAPMLRSAGFGDRKAPDRVRLREVQPRPAGRSVVGGSPAEVRHAELGGAATLARRAGGTERVGFATELLESGIAVLEGSQVFEVHDVLLGGFGGVVCLY